MKRKAFIKKVGALSTVMTGAPFIASRGKSKTYELPYHNVKSRKYSANDHINIALIGAGNRGQSNTSEALEQNGIKLVAVCDLYQSRLTRCKERWGNDVFTSMDYHEIINRDDVDAVIIASSDHWHERQAVDSLNQGKSVYLEKPMIQHAEEGHRVIQAEQSSGKTLLIGSQRTSSIVYEKVRELLQNGEIGELNFVEATTDRFDPVGAWQYSIPPDASPDNIAWDTYIKDLPPRPFDPKHFFRWRNYKDYGTGVAGDLFVHLFSGLHMVTGSSGPNSIMATGGLRYWHDGRDVPDVMLGLFDYPESESHPAFNLALRVNFVDGSGSGSIFRIVGSEGVIDIGRRSVTLRKASLPDRPRMTIGDFSEETQKKFKEYYRERYPDSPPEIINPSEFIYRAPDGYSSRNDHFHNFFNAIRNDTPVLQDGTFGLRAAGPAVLSNLSYEQKSVVSWDPENMKVV